MKKFITTLFTSYRGSNRLSRLLRSILERRSIQELIGIPLAGLAFFGAVFLPQVQAGLSTTEVFFDTQTTVVDALVTPSRFRWPLAAFGISQYFARWHPGLDLTDPKGTLMYPIADGKVTRVVLGYTGYGKHVVIEHADGMSSLYAHLSQIRVKEGEQITKDTALGSVGATGWATGNHLHLEIYQNGVAINPMEVLPQAKKYETREISQTLGPSVPTLSL